ncbi:MAG: hypothetical protein A6F71_03440 [Cycloclasticus sp. symbiont of Poecilosclerida sp. M]|nr:MAG: hypothetical protein A6F71_03440 [Cycloclasticus sp. symbiont of Poecilosclerida sp. M]
MLNVLSSSKSFLIACATMFGMLLIIWWPSFMYLGDLFGYAQEESIQGVSLLDFFKAELLIMLVVGVVLLNYKKVRQVTDGMGRVNRHLVLFVWVSGQVIVGFVAGGFLAHQDTPWYQAVGEAGGIMPAQAIILLVCYPAYLFFGGGAYIYTKTRLPKFLEGKKIVYLILTFAPLVFLPYYKGGVSVAPNELLEFIYLVVCWLLSTAWLVVGVLYLVFKSAKEILDGLHRPYDEDVY